MDEIKWHMQIGAVEVGISTLVDVDRVLVWLGLVFQRSLMLVCCWLGADACWCCGLFVLLVVVVG